MLNPKGLFRPHWRTQAQAGKSTSTSERVVPSLVLSHSRTTITITHRLSTIKRSDVIHVIEDGRVVESGSHEELLRRRGRYLELVQAQI